MGVGGEDSGSLTAVAATAVLGTRVSALGHDALAGHCSRWPRCSRPVLLLLVVRRRRPRMPGSVFLRCVATQALAVLAATLAAAESAAWLARVALALFWFGSASTSSPCSASTCGR
ncbi:tellurite resistance/C4-dicarboxylate transporter family protein [Streptomyces hirsutus]